MFTDIKSAGQKEDYYVSQSEATYYDTGPGNKKTEKRPFYFKYILASVAVTAILCVAITSCGTFYVTQQHLHNGHVLYSGNQKCVNNSILGMFSFNSTQFLINNHHVSHI